MQTIQPGVAMKLARKPLAILVSGLMAGGAVAQAASAIQLTSIDLETALMAVQGERIKLLDQQLNQQIQQAQARNEQISKLNNELNSLTVQRDKLGTGTKANQAQLSQLNAQIASVRQQIDKLSSAGQIDYAQLLQKTTKQNAATELIKKLEEKRQLELAQKLGQEQKSEQATKTLQEQPKATETTKEQTQTTKEALQQQEQQLKLLQEKIKQIQADPSQKKQLLEKQKEFAELQQKMLQTLKQQESEQTKQAMQGETRQSVQTAATASAAPATTSTPQSKVEALQGAGLFETTKQTPDLSGEMTREQLKEILSQPSSAPGQSPGGQFTTVTNPEVGVTAVALAPIIVPQFQGLGNGLTASSRADILAMLDAFQKQNPDLSQAGEGLLDGVGVAQILRARTWLESLGTGDPGVQQLLAIIQGSLLAAEVARQTLAVQSAAAAAGYPYMTAGNALPFASWPTAMVATYNGRVSGALNSGASIGGGINMTVDFAQLQAAMNPGVNGSITFDNGQGGMSFALVRSGSYVGNSASGTFNGQAVTGYIMNGQFYGPQAQEIGGQWSMQNAGATLTANGNFAAKR